MPPSSRIHSKWVWMLSQLTPIIEVFSAAKSARISLKSGNLGRADEREVLRIKEQHDKLVLLARKTYPFPICRDRGRQVEVGGRITWFEHYGIALRIKYRYRNLSSQPKSKTAATPLPHPLFPCLFGHRSKMTTPAARGPDPQPQAGELGMRQQAARRVRCQVARTELLNFRS